MAPLKAGSGSYPIFALLWAASRRSRPAYQGPAYQERDVRGALLVICGGTNRSRRLCLSVSLVMPATLSLSDLPVVRQSIKSSVLAYGEVVTPPRPAIALKSLSMLFAVQGE